MEENLNSILNEKTLLAKKIYEKLTIDSNGEIFPNCEKYNQKIYFTYYLKLKEEYEKDLREYVNLIVRDKENFYDTLLEFGKKKLEEYTKRQRLNYIYQAKIGIEDKQGNEKLFDLYDMSILKIQDENFNMYPETYYKKIPDWMKDIKSFTDILIPLDCQTVFLYNPEQKAVIDLRKEELFLIPH